MENAKFNVEIEALRKELKNLKKQVNGLGKSQHREISECRKLLLQSTKSDDTQSASKSEDSFAFKPIGVIETWYKSKNGTPRQPTVCSLSKGKIKINIQNCTNPQYALTSLADFSHVWLLFVFHKNSSLEFSKTKVAPPRLNGQRVGIFSTRSPHRPNPIGLSLVKLDSIEGNEVVVTGIDLVDGTPILDIKPYIPSYDRPSNETTDTSTSEIHVPQWIEGSRKLQVSFTGRAMKQLQSFQQSDLKDLNSWQDLKQAILDILSEDPRSVYRKDKCSDQLYFLTVDTAHVTAWFDDEENVVEVIKVKHMDQTQK